MNQQGGEIMERLTREMTFEEEYIILQKEVKELFDKEDRESEPPESHCVVRRALRCIKKLVAELEPYREYKDLEEQGLLLRLPCKVGSTLYQPISNRINEYGVIGLCFDIHRNKFMYEVAYQVGLEWYKTTCDFDCINKTVFLTQAEAEQKLKEMKNK